MPEPNVGLYPSVLHVVGPDTPVDRLAVLNELRLRSAAAAKHAVLAYGAIGAPLGTRPDVVRVLPPFGLAWLAPQASPELLGFSVWHVWSPAALRWVIAQRASSGPARTETPRLVADCDLSTSPRDLAAWRRVSGAPELQFICASLTAQRRLLQHGLSLDATVVIRDGVDFGALHAVDRAAVRAALRFEPHQTVALALPPVQRGGGAFYAAWGVMLAQKIARGLRLVVPGDGPETHRVGRMARACRHEHVVRCVGRTRAPHELLAACDLAVCLPRRDMPLPALPWAMAAACPIVASATPCVSELLVHGHNAWLARPDEPRDIARRLLQAVEHADEARRRAHIARMQAYKVFSRQRMLEQFEAAWLNLSRGRAVSHELADAALPT
jgi:glycosyltransferase involved in cell wall biosynthesis